MKKISILIKPASSKCNIKCKYCFYADVSDNRQVQFYGKMSYNTVDKMLDNIYVDLNDGDQLVIGFQGGEPTLAGLNYFKYFVNKVNEQAKNINVKYALQTNGMIINERWCKFFKENNFLIGLSMDGGPMFHDINRLDMFGKGTYYRVRKTKQLFDEYNIEYNILCVLTEELSYYANEVFQYLLSEKIRYIQFIPCIDDLNRDSKSCYALTPEGFSRFYCTLLPLWRTQLSKGNYISIKLFDDIFNLLVRSEVNACGLVGNCQIQFVIEADGSVFPCDFYALDELKLGNITTDTIKQLLLSKRSKLFLCSRKLSDLSDKCKSCKYFQICRGGCKRMTHAMYLDENKDYCGYEDFLNKYIPNIKKIISMINRIKV